MMRSTDQNWIKVAFSAVAVCTCSPVWCEAESSATLGTGDVVAVAMPDAVPEDRHQPVTAPAPDSALPMLAQPWRDVTLASGMDSALLEVRVREGDIVSAGQVLALQDWRVAKASVSAAEASASRTAELDNAQLELMAAQQRVQRLRSAGRAASRADLEEAEVRLAQAEAGLRSAVEANEQAKRNLELELARLDQYLLRAPFDGRIVAVLAQAGQMLTTGEPVIRVVDTATLRVEARVPTDETRKLDLGSVFLLWDAAGDSHHATLDFRSPLLDPASETFRVVYAIDNRDEALPAGSAVMSRKPESSLSEVRR